MRKNIRHIVFFLSIIMLLGTCKNNSNTIPDYTVYFEIRLNDFDSDFAIGNVKTFNSNRGYTGYFGVVVYRHDLEEFYAYDRACPYDYGYGCAVIRDTTKSYALDVPYFQCSDCCGSQFYMMDGQVIKTNSSYKYNLKQYQVSKIENRSGVFLVYN